LTTSLTIYGFGLRGNSANESIGKHRFQTKKHQKVNKSSQKTMAYLFGYWRPRVRVPPLRPKRKEGVHPLFFLPWRIDSNSYCEQSEAGSSALILRRAHDARISAASSIILPLGKAPATLKINPQVRNLHRFSLFFEHLNVFFNILQLQVAFFKNISVKSIDFYHII
ncbi:MAG: hypothetical protein IJP20_01055, partial [Clostridia bacterium]|nr:hypothetical protein [Clostridia bacterium]